MSPIKTEPQQGCAIPHHYSLGPIWTYAAA